MSIRLMASAWQMRGINPGAKLVLLALCDNASDRPPPATSPPSAGFFASGLLRLHRYADTLQSVGRWLST